MSKVLTADTRLDEQKPGFTATSARTYEPEEFEADTQEERPIAVLAEKRRQFLAGLKTRDAAAETVTGR